MKLFYKLVLGLGILGLGLLPALVLAAGQVYISGVQTSGGTGHTTNDFIELYNPSADPVNLKGLNLVKRTATGTTDSSIKAWSTDSFIPGYSFYLWANSGFTTIGAVPDATSAASIADDNGIALKSDNSSVLDSLAWGSTSNGFDNVSGNIVANSVLERQDLFSGQSAYVVVASAAPRNTSVQVLPPAPTSVPEPVVIPADPVPNPPPIQVQPAAPVYFPLQITELLANPSGTDDGQEQIEIYNPNALDVDVSGWFLDDGTGAAPTASSFTLSGLIHAGEFKSFVTPAGKFALNNTGGDSVQLFSPDKKVVDSVTYTGTADENKSYQKFDTGWQWGDPSLGVQNVLPPPSSATTTESSLSTSTNATAVTYQGFAISEFYPALAENEDAWIEIANTTDNDIDISQWQIDVASTHLKKPSDSAIVIAGPKNVPAHGFIKAVIPADIGNALDAEGKYWMLLYSPDDKQQDALSVKGLDEKLSYSKIAAMGWQWTTPTPEFMNLPYVEPAIQFTEVLPAYKNEADSSFIELRNVGADPVYLGNLKLKIGSKALFLPNYTIQPGEYYAVYNADLAASPSVKGAKLALIDPNGKVFAALNYPKAPTDLAYMLNGNGKWSWTAEPTPSEANVFEPGGEAAAAPAEKSLQSKIASLNKTIASLKKTKASAKTTSKTAAKATAKPSNKNSNDLPADGGGQPAKKPALAIGIAAGLVAAAGTVIWVYTKEPKIS